MGQPRKLIKGILHPVGPRPGSKAHARIINAASQRRKEPLLHSRLDGLLSSTNPKICVYRRLGGIGDVVMTTPLVKHIKRLLPNCHLVYATDLRYSNGALGDILRHNPFIDEVVSFDTVSAADFDLFTDVTATGLSEEKTGKIPPNRIDMFARQVGVDISMDPLPTYIVSDDEAEWAQRKMKSYCLPHEREEVTVIGIQAKSNDKRRTWPLDYSRELVKILVKDPKVRVVMFHWEQDTRWHMPQTFTCSESLRYTAALVNECDVMVVPDSALLHIAGALQKKTVAIFGPVPPESRINYYQNCSAVVAGLPCQFCWYSPTCGQKLNCLTKIEPEIVYKAIQDKIHEKEIVQEVISVQGPRNGFRPDNVVLVKRHWGGFGDIIASIPGIEALHKKYPTKKVYYALPEKYWPAAENNPYIDKLLDINKPIQQNRYAVIIDISSPCAQYEAKRITTRKPVELSRVEIYAQALGTRDFVTDIRGRYYISEEEKEFAQEWLPKTDKPRLGVVLRTAEDYRCWPIDKYKKLIPIITDKFQVVVIDPVREFDFPNVVDACGFPFRKMASIVGECDMILTPDTSVLHLAAALDIPTIAMFGPIDAQVRCKGHTKTKVLITDFDCIPCWRNCTMACKRKGTPVGYSACMENLSISAVYNALMELGDKL